MLPTTEAILPDDRILSRRVCRERRTLKVMLSMYCRRHHPFSPATDHLRSLLEPRDQAGLCQECVLLLAYAFRRIDNCRFGDQKPTCARCPVHCFRADMRERIRVVMRYSGPRMTLRHPYLAARHLLDSKSSFGHSGGAHSSRM